MAEAIEAIRQQELLLPEEEKVVGRLLITHNNPHFIGFDLADHAELEPMFNDAEAYAAWALEFVKTHGVECIVASRNLEALALNEAAFEAMGVKVLKACDLSTWNEIDDKIAFYHKLQNAGAGEMLPRWTTWRSDLSTSLNDAISCITAAGLGEPKREACIKPARGIFGQGFFHFQPEPDVDQLLFNVDAKLMEPSRFAPLAFASGKAKGHSDWMVMEFMPGSEFSVDCLAWDGKLVSAVAREKRSPANHGQVIVNDPNIEKYCEQLAQIFGMQGVFNAQFKVDVTGELRILEINPRFSGGMGMSLLSGVNLVWWWIKLAYGADPATVPVSQPDVRVYSWRKAVCLPDIRA